MSDSIWKVLSAVDCSAHIEKKGQFSYLSWTFAWAMVKERYSTARYDLLPDTTYPDGTMEVRVSVTIGDEPRPNPNNLMGPITGLTHTMWLPVLDYKNKPIPNPNAFDINTARMRCLVKCLAMFGLGHYIYAGESAPQEQPVTYTDDQRTRLIDLMANNDGWGLKQFGQEVGNDVMAAMFSSFQKGQVSKNKQLVRELVGGANEELRKTLAYIDDSIQADSPSSIAEAFEELTDLQRSFVMAGLTEVQITQIVDMGMKV